MNINFPPVDESYIKAKIADGFYSNAAELVRDACGAPPTGAGR